MPKFKEGDKVIMIACSDRTLRYSRNNDDRVRNKKRFFKNRVILVVKTLVTGGIITRGDTMESHKIANDDLVLYRKPTVIL